MYGQLGLGFDCVRAKYPQPLEEFNDLIGGSSAERAPLISCGANFSLCYTDLGLLYCWGMPIPEQLESIQWVPNFLKAPE